MVYSWVGRMTQDYYLANHLCNPCFMRYYGLYLVLGSFVILLTSCTLGSEQNTQIENVLAPPLRIACVGNSITEGAGIKQPALNSYPSKLSRKLGMSCDVRNFGVGGRTLLRNGDYPYWNERAFHEALAFNPQIVVIEMGTNDTKPDNWQYKEDFISNYQALIDTFLQLPSHPQVWICTPVPAFSDNYDINPNALSQEVIPMIREISSSCKVPLIDLHSILQDKQELFPDDIHPNAEGAGIIANTVYRVIRQENI